MQDTLETEDWYGNFKDLRDRQEEKEFDEHVAWRIRKGYNVFAERCESFNKGLRCELLLKHSGNHECKQDMIFTNNWSNPFG